MRPLNPFLSEPNNARGSELSCVRVDFLDKIRAQGISVFYIRQFNYQIGPNNAF